MPTVTTDYYGMEGTGKNLKEAKLDASRKIQAALKGRYTPRILVHGQYAILIYREPTGWHSRIIADPEAVRAGHIHGSQNGDGSEESEIRCAQRHLADLGRTGEPGEQPPSFLTDKEDIREWHSKAEFLKRAKLGRLAGLEDWELHQYACGSHGRPDLEKRVDDFVSQEKGLSHE